jgi:hypothetical protein
VALILAWSTLGAILVLLVGIARRRRQQQPDPASYDA